jgi:hypothetical protein
MVTSKGNQNVNARRNSVTEIVAACVMAAVALYMAVPVALDLPGIDPRDVWPAGVFAIILFVMGVVLAKSIVQCDRAEGSK